MTTEAIVENESSEIEELTDEVPQEDPEAKGVSEEKAKPETNDVARAVIAERRKWERRVDELEKKSSRFDEIEKRLNEFQSQKQSPEPDFDADPAGYLKTNVDKLSESQQQIQQSLEQQKHQQEYAQNIQRSVARVKADEAAFTKNHADYLNALNHVRERERQRFLLAGFEPHEAEQALEQNELNIVLAIYERGGNPVEYIYHYAQALGYQPANGKDDDLEKLEKGMKASKTLGSGATRKDLEEMSDDEFDNAMAEMFGK